MSGDAAGAEDVQEEYASYQGVEESPVEEEVKAIEGEGEERLQSNKDGTRKE